MYILTYMHTIKLCIYIHIYTHIHTHIHLNLYKTHNNNNKKRLDADFVNSILYNTSNKTIYVHAA